MPTDSTHRAIIKAIDKKWSDGLTPFAIHEIRDASGVSTSTVTRVLNTLVRLDIVKHNKKGFMGRHYKVTYRWVSSDKVIEDYEYAKALKL